MHGDNLLSSFFSVILNKFTFKYYFLGDFDGDEELYLLSHFSIVVGCHGFGTKWVCLNSINLEGSYSITRNNRNQEKKEPLESFVLFGCSEFFFKRKLGGKIASKFRRCYYC